MHQPSGIKKALKRRSIFLPANFVTKSYESNITSTLWIPIPPLPLCSTWINKPSIVNQFLCTKLVMRKDILENCQLSPSSFCCYAMLVFFTCANWWCFMVFQWLLTFSESLTTQYYMYVCMFLIYSDIITIIT